MNHRFLIGILLCLLLVGGVQATVWDGAVLNYFNTTGNATDRTIVNVTAGDLAQCRDLLFNTYCGYSTTAGAWSIGYEFPSSRRIGAISLWSLNANDRIQYYKIQYSDDEAAWTDATLTGWWDNTAQFGTLAEAPNINGWNTVNFTPANGTYWRVKILTSWTPAAENAAIMELVAWEAMPSLIPPAPTVSFTTNVTSDVNPLTVALNDTSTGSPTYWNTSWGESPIPSWTNQTSFPATNITHLYSTAGTYWINHYASNAYGTSNGTPIQITVYGFANSQFSLFNALGGVPFTTYLYDTSTNTTGGTNTWYWMLGDGNVSTAQNLYYTWNITGTYSVNHSFSNGLSTSWNNKSNYVTVGTSVIAPVASFNGTPSLGANPLTQFFIDVSANTPTSWNWSFGDGSVSDEQNPQHTYTDSGFFTVNFSATNTAGTDWANKTDFVVVY